MSKKLGQIAGILFFALVVTVPPVVGLFISNDIRKMERRKAATWPAIPQRLKQLEKWPRKIESYVNDNIGFRDQAVLANGWLHWTTGYPYGPVVLGRDGNLFRTNFGILDLYRGVFRFPDRSVFENRLQEFLKLRNELAQQGIEFYMTLIPNKITLFGENNLPGWLNKKAHTPTLLEEYEQELSEKLDQNYISAFDVLKPSSGSNIYSKYGIHWNELGALITLTEIASRISVNHPVGPVHIRDFDIRHIETREDTANARAAGLSGYLKNNLPKLSSKTASIIMKKSKQGVIANRGAERQTFHFVNEDPPNKLKVLIIGDSFTLSWHSTAPVYFSETVFTHHNLGRIDMKTVAAFKPDIVVFQMVEQQLYRYFEFRPE